MSYVELIEKINSPDFSCVLRQKINIWLNVDPKLCRELILIVCEKCDPSFEFFEIISEYDLFDVDKHLQYAMGSLLDPILESDMTKVVYLIETYNIEPSLILSTTSDYLMGYIGTHENAVINFIDKLYNYGLCFTNEMANTPLFNRLLRFPKSLLFLIKKNITIEQIIISMKSNRSNKFTPIIIDNIINSFDLTVDQMSFILNTCDIFNDSFRKQRLSEEAINKIIDVGFDYKCWKIIRKILENDSIPLFEKLYENNPVGTRNYILNGSDLSWVIKDYVLRNNIVTQEDYYNIPPPTIG